MFIFFSTVGEGLDLGVLGDLPGEPGDFGVLGDFGTFPAAFRPKLFSRLLNGCLGRPDQVLCGVLISLDIPRKHVGTSLELTNSNINNSLSLHVNPNDELYPNERSSITNNCPD